MAGESLVPSLPLFHEEAARALRVFKRLRVPDIHGMPTLGEACGPWFFPIAAALFGAYDPEVHVRMLQEFFLLIPKGNSKSSYGGPLMLAAAIVNRRPEAEFSFIAPTIKIANIAFGQTKGTIKLDPELDKLFQIQTHLRTITHRLNGTKLQIKAADTDIVTGGKDVGTLIDETHVFAKKANAADIFVELRGSLGKRKDGFLLQITTQSKEPPSGVFKSELERARAVRDGKIALPLLPVLYEFPEHMLETDAWKEKRYWPLVNPNLGRSINADYLDRELRDAEREGKEKLILVASQHFNIEIGLRLRSDRWRGADHWEQAVDKSITLDSLLERSEVVTIGADGGGLDDLFGLAVEGRCKTTGEWLSWARAWVQADVLDERKDIAPKLLDFAKDGDLVICDLPGQDVEEIADIIEQVNDAGLLPKKYGVGLDAVGVAALVDELVGRGIETHENGGPVCAVPQGYRLNGAIKGMERKLKDKTFRPAAQPMMIWCVGNAKAILRGNAVMIDKQTAGSAKIDPLIAKFNAFYLMSRSPEAGAKKVVFTPGSLYV